VISLFLTFSEVTAGIAAVRAEGWIQAVFTIFSVVFPIAVGTTFFVFLWKKPFVLYAPGDYSADTPVESFVQAMTANRTRETAAVDSALAEALDDVLAAVLQSTEAESAEDVAVIAEQAVTSARAEVERRAVTVSLARFPTRNRAEAVAFVVDEQTTVQDLLNFVYFAIADAVEPYRYGRQWLLRDITSGHVYGELGSSARDIDRGRFDERLLADIGIHPGAQLEVVRPTS
jgi:hypothetical protein